MRTLSYRRSRKSTGPSSGLALWTRITALVGLLFTGCAAIDLQQVKPEELNISVALTQTPEATHLDVSMKRGLFRQPVRLNSLTAQVRLTDGQLEPLIPSNDAGRYGLRLGSAAAIAELSIESIGNIAFPVMPAVILSSYDPLEDKLFSKEAAITLRLEQTGADERFIIATAHCGRRRYSSEREITTAEKDLIIPLKQLMQSVNNAAEADLTGIIPLTLTLEERYRAGWPTPFEVRRIAANDSTQFSVDTARFRVQGTLTLSTNNLLLRITNQPWPARYCL